MKRINSFLMFILVALGICLAADMSASGIASDSAYLPTAQHSKGKYL